MMSKVQAKQNLLIFASIAILSGCAGGHITSGTGGTAAMGAAGGGTSVGANSGLERCDKTLGTLAVDDGRAADWHGRFGSKTNVTTIEPLIRLAVQQSNCFVITSIGNLRTDSRLSRVTDLQRNSGEYRAGSKQQKGQRVAADYYMEPQIIIDNASSGQVGGAIGGLLGGMVHPTLGTLAASMESKASVVTLTLFDIRSAIQISASEGSSTANNYGAALGAFGSRAGGRLSGFSRTPSGKATVAAFIDAYNGMVRALKHYKAQDVEGGLGRGGALKVN